MMPIIIEQQILSFREVLKIFLNSGSLESYSAVYLTTPVLIAPFAKVKITVIKFVNCPTSAIPAGPVNNATNLLATKPEAMRIIVITAEKKDVLISFNGCQLWYFLFKIMQKFS